MFGTLLTSFGPLVLLLIIVMIYVGPFILVLSSIIFVLTRKSIDIISRILIAINILLIAFLLFVTLIKFIDEPGKNYSKMRGINNSKSMIGLSKEEVENKLGKPGKIEKSENVYLYDAGTLHREVTRHTSPACCTPTFISFSPSSPLDISNARPEPGLSSTPWRVIPIVHG